MSGHHVNVLQAVSASSSAEAQPIVALPDWPSWPYTCLSVAATSRLAEIAGIANRYELLVTPSRFAGWHHLRPMLCEEGDHKRQAVTMFIASVELIHKAAIEDALLYEVSQLHLNLLRACGRDSSRYSPDGVLAQHGRMNGVLTILQPTALHLREAGFALSSRQQEERLTKEDVRAMMQDLLHEGQVSRATTCSAF